jgi:hypothetical protein
MGTDNPSNSSAPQGLEGIPVMIERWAALAGRWRFEPGFPLYQGPGVQFTQPLGLALASTPFRDGRIRATVQLTRTQKTTAGIFVGYQSLDAPYVVAQIGAYDRAYAISQYRPNCGWEAQAEAGMLTNLQPGKAYPIELRLAGQTLTMVVDDIQVLSMVLTRPLDGTGMGLFAFDDAEVQFGETTIVTSKPKVFVMMPFSEPFNSLYEDVIKEVAISAGFDIVRADEILGPGIIIADMQRQITECQAVVTEISTANPNVFYELGYAHALGKPAVLLIRRESGRDIPFDIRGYRAIVYDDSISGKKIVERNLEQHLRSVKRDPMIA